MPHGRLSQHPPDAAETVLVKPGHCTAELTDASVMPGTSLEGRARLAAGFRPAEDFRTGTPKAARAWRTAQTGVSKPVFCFLFL